MKHFRKISPKLKSEIAGFFRLYRMSYCVTIRYDDRTSYDFLSTDLLNSLCEYFNISLLLIVFDETQQKYRIDFINSNKNVNKGKELENNTLKPCISLHHINSNHFVSVKLSIDKDSYLNISFDYSFIFYFSTSLYNLYNSKINKQHFINRQIQETKHKFGNVISINKKNFFVYSSIIGNNIKSNDFYYYKPSEEITIPYNTRSINNDSKFIINNNKIVLYSKIRNKDKKKEIEEGKIKLFVKILGGKIIRIYDSRLIQFIINNPINYKYYNISKFPKKNLEKKFNFYFNKSYKKNYSLNQYSKEYIYEIILYIFLNIRFKYRENKELNKNSIKYEPLFLEKFEKYMHSIIRVLLLLKIKNKDKIQQQIDEISNYVYENMLNDLLNSKSLSIDSKNNTTINKKLQNIIKKIKYSNKITNIN